MFALKLSLLISLTVVNAASFTPFLSNGSEAQIAEFPYLVSIQEINVHIGHGSMLNEKWILSCARVFTGKRITDLNIEYGNTVITPGPNTENDVRISQFILHENFNVPTPFANDISLIESETSIYIDLHQPFAKLVIPGGSRFLSGVQSTFASWGHIAPGNVRTRQLQKADLKILSHEECIVAVDDSPQPTEQNICAIGESAMCIADLGAPLLTNGVVVGVASSRGGRQCEPVEGKYPNIYTDVSYYTKWIETHTGIDYQLNLFLQKTA